MDLFDGKPLSDGKPLAATHWQSSLSSASDHLCAPPRPCRIGLTPRVRSFSFSRCMRPRNPGTCMHIPPSAARPHPRGRRGEPSGGCARRMPVLSFCRLPGVHRNTTQTHQGKPRDAASARAQEMPRGQTAMRRALRMCHQRGCAPWHRRVSYLGHAALRADQAFMVRCAGVL